MENSTNKYMENYNILENISKSFDDQSIPDIDIILPKIDEATKAYNYCLDRINKVKKVLEDIESKNDLT